MKNTKDYRALAEQFARLCLRMIEGSDAAYDEADKLVKRHFPAVYEEYQ